MSSSTRTVKSYNNTHTVKHMNNNNSTPTFHTNTPAAASLKPISSVSSKTHQQQPKKKMQSTKRPNNSRHSNKKSHNNPSDDGLSSSSSFSSSSSSSSEDEPATPDRKQHHTKKVYQKEKSAKNNFEYKSFVDQVYAGPTFNNAPAPSALPIPAFNARGSPINYPQPLYQPVKPSLQQQSIDLMNLITPQKVDTAYELEKTNMALSEIQRGLRSMLKIES